jgi:hypothetical protein
MTCALREFMRGGSNGQKFNYLFSLRFGSSSINKIPKLLA